MVELLEAHLKGVEEVIFLFLCFLFVLLSCKLLWKDLNELVSLMERDPSCSMETLYERCESRLCEGIGEETSGEQKDEEK
jgi:hypothetical protein